MEKSGLATRDYVSQSNHLWVIQIFVAGKRQLFDLNILINAFIYNLQVGLSTVLHSQCQARPMVILVTST